MTLPYVGRVASKNQMQIELVGVERDVLPENDAQSSTGGFYHFYFLSAMWEVPPVIFITFIFSPPCGRTRTSHHRATLGVTHACLCAADYAAGS